MKTKTHTQLSEILKGKYQGYLWNASAKEPEIYKGTENITINEQEMPVIEGLLYDTEKEVSIHIVYTHRYIITEYELDSDDKLEEKEYMPHNKLKDEVKSIKMAKVWQEKEEENCEGMPTLTLVAHIFRGFNLKS